MAISSKSDRPDTSTWRVMGVVGLSTGLMAAAWLLAAFAFRDVPAVLGHVPSPDALIVAVAEVAGSLVACWLSLGVLLTVLSVLAGTRPTVPVLPPSLRRLVVGLLGASTVVAVAVPANAAGTATGASTHRAVATTAADPLDPGWVPGDQPKPHPDHTAAPTPSRPAPAATPGHRTPGPTAGHDVSRSSGSTAVVTVHRGDTLWDIARRQLDRGGHHATPGEIARAWPRWFHANEAAIGGDPDHIVPGSRLHRPTTN